MFKRKPKTSKEIKPAEGKPQRKKPSLLRISVIANIAVVVIAVLVGVGGIVIHESNTNPNFCATCHIMQRNVSSYQTSSNLDHVHEEAGVQCKDCHNYPLSAEITSGVDFLIGNYTVGDDGELVQRKYDNDMCLKCHISYDKIAQQTDYLEKNPHESHFKDLPCNTCHISHGTQIDYCASCHDNGGQRMVGGPIIPRADNPWATDTGDASADPNAPSVEPTTPASASAPQG